MLTITINKCALSLVMVIKVGFMCAANLSGYNEFNYVYSVPRELNDIPLLLIIVYKFIIMY